MSVKNQSEFDSQNNSFIIYPSAKEAPKESSKFLYLLEDTKQESKKSNSEPHNTRD